MQRKCNILNQRKARVIIMKYLTGLDCVSSVKLTTPLYPPHFTDDISAIKGDTGTVNVTIVHFHNLTSHYPLSSPISNKLVFLSFI